MPAVNSADSCFVFIFCVPGAQVQRELAARRERWRNCKPKDRSVATQVGPDQREMLEMRLSATNPGYQPRDDKAIDAIVRADAGKSPTVPTRRSVPWPLHGRCGGQLPAGVREMVITPIRGRCGPNAACRAEATLFLDLTPT